MSAKKTLIQSQHNVMGLVHPYRLDHRVQGKVPIGTTVYDAIRQCCEAAKIRRKLINYGIAQIGRRNYEKQVTEWTFIPFSEWKKHRLQEGELLRFRILPKGGGGGGGGKNPLNTALMVVVAVAAIAATVFTAGTLAPALGLAAQGIGATILGGLAGMAVLTIGQALVNAIAPVSAVSAPSFGGLSSSQNKESSVYSISGGRNSVNQWGCVPVPVGRGRFAPPKAAAPYTQNFGDDQYLHELLCLGIGDMDISSIKIGTTPIEEFADVEWEVMTYYPTAPKAPKYYPTGIYEETLNIELKYGDTYTRATQECDYADIDFSFQGLCHLDDNGNPERAEVSFEISYSAAGRTTYETVGESTYVHGVSLWQPDHAGEWAIVVNPVSGIMARSEIGAVGDNEYRLGYFKCEFDGDARICTFTENIARSYSIADGFEVTVHNGDTNSVWGLSVAGGYLTESVTGAYLVNAFTVEGAQTRLLRRTYRINFPRRGIYQITVRRITEDATDTRVRDESYWTSLRSATKDLPIDTKYPVMLLSLQIRASGQISGSIDTLTVYYETKAKIFSGNSLVSRYTSNSAAIMLYILTQEHCWAFPQSIGQIDLDSFKKAYTFCAQHKFNFNKVFDSQGSLFEQLVSVGASCLSSPTILDGKWGIITDSPRENVVCAFTCANSWNWKFERTQIKLPNSIHCDFVNEATWESDMREVPTDEPIDGISVWETQAYDGVTNPDQIWYLARFHYADAKRRRRTISFTAYDESILCTRGDLVELCCPNVGVQGLQVGRIRKLIKNAAGYITAIKTDQLNQTDNSGRRFGVKIYANSGDIFHVRVKAENKMQRLLTFETPQNIAIQDGNKYAFGDWSEEVFQAVVLSMKFNSDWTCDITCQDYDPLLYGSLSGQIPDFQSVITRPIELKWVIESIPTITHIISDESVLAYGSNGTLVCQAEVFIKDPTNLDPRAAYYNIQIRRILSESGASVIYDVWRNAVKNEPIQSTSCIVPNVDEGAVYEFRARYIGVYGEVGNWSNVVRHKIVGTTAPPPDVKNFRATITNPDGIWLTWDNITYKDIAFYKIWGAATANPIVSPYLHKPYRQLGLLEFFIVAVDRGGRESKNPAKASCTVYRPKNIVFTAAELLDEGVVATWENCASTWNIQQYRIRVRGYTGIHVHTNFGCVVPWSGRFYKNELMYALPMDIFENWALNEAQRIVKIYPPLTPKITLGFDKTNGNVMIDWQDCKNPAKPNTPTIDYYVLTGTLASGKPLEVKGLHYESIVPLIIYEFGAGTVEGGIPVNVGNIHVQVIAVDKYGITSKDADDYKDNSVDLELFPPYNPTDFGVSAVVNGDDLDAQWTESTAIMLTWRDCERTLAIDHYTVYDSYTNTEYKVATNYIVLPVRPEGTYPITVQAFDVLGLESAPMTYNLSIGGVGGMEVNAKIDGSDILLQWTAPDSTFAIDHYIVMKDNDELPSGTNADRDLPGYIGEAKFNFYRVPGGKVGSYTYYVWAVDAAGNINTKFANYTTIEIVPNIAPTITAKVDGTGVALAWKRNEVANSLPVVAWDVRRYKHLNSTNEIPLNTEIQDYGRLDVTKTNVNAFVKGDYTFAVRAYDSGGNEGVWGICDFKALPPGQVMFTNTIVLDNNIQLYWTEPNFIFFAIKEYIFAEVQQDNKGNDVHMEIGRVDALFVSTIEGTAGDYVYSVTPIDWGGNRGTPTKISMAIKQPPDFQLFGEFDSLFNGIKDNMALDGYGHMIGPFPTGETWIQNRQRASDLAGRVIETHLEKVQAGYETWLEPEALQGSYTEIIDHGAVIESCNYRIDLDWLKLKGEPAIVCKIEISDDGVEWRTITENGTQAYANHFRYSRITLTVTRGVVQISRIYVTLSLKKVNDYGRVHCDKNDNGEGWISEAVTPMLTGTWVPFNETFIDVQSLPKPNVINHPDYTAYTIFEDVIYPKGFRVFIKDRDGNRVTADADWVANGV